MRHQPPNHPDAGAMKAIIVSVHTPFGSTLDLCSPLDILVARIRVNDKALRGSSADLTVFDGRNRRYLEQRLSLDRDATEVHFMAAGAVGRHRIELKPCHLEAERAIVEFTVKAVTVITSSPDPEYAELFEAMARHNASCPTHSMAGKEVRGVSWIRDHTHCLKGLKYTEPDLKTMVDLFLDHQMPGGGYYDFFHVKPDGAPDLTPDGNAIFERMDGEADLEYLLVEAVHTVWQATGDDAWMRACLPKLEKGLSYTFTHPHRWSDEHQLLKRPFTIDTWDFEYLEDDLTKSGNRVLIAPYGWLARMIDERTKFCVMHGDNSGLMKACRLMAAMHEHSGSSEKAGFWAERAERIRERANLTCWNGRFYAHQVHIDPVRVAGDEASQLSLSNAYDINRGLPSHQQAVSIIREYQRRKASSGSFAEWFSIDPPFPNGAFKGESSAWRDAGEYINGTVMPLVAGELARACFEHGFERYGVDILRRLYALLQKDGKLHFMYRRDGSAWRLRGRTSEGGGPNLWGATAVLYALMEGLAGVEDCHKLYQRAKLSPRWAATAASDVRVVAGYASSQAYIAYRYRHDRDRNRVIIDFAGSGDEILFHVLIPEGCSVAAIRNEDGAEVAAQAVRIEESLYMDFVLAPAKKQVVLEIETSAVETGGERRAVVAASEMTAGGGTLR